MTKFESIRGRAFYFLSLAWFLWFMNFMSRTIFAPILPLIEDEFSVTHGAAAGIFTCISFGFGLSLFLSGISARILGFRKAVAVSAGATAVLFPLVSLVRVFEVFYPLGFVLGMAVGMYLPAMLSLLTDYYDERLWGKVIAIHDSGASISTTAAPFVALVILSSFPWRAIFIVLGVASAVVTLVFCLVSHEVATPRGKKHVLGSLLKNRSLWIMGVLFICVGGSSLGLYFVTPLYLVKELQLDVAYANTIFGISRIATAIAAISVGFYVDRFSLKKTLFFIIVLGGLLTVALGLSSVQWIAIVLFVQALVVVGFFPVAFVAIARIFDRELRGQAVGFVATLNVLFGSGVIPYLLGLSGDFVGFRFGICLLGILTTLASSLVYFLKELD